MTLPSDSVTYRLVFDVAQAGYRYWWFPAVGSIFLTIGVAWLLVGKRMPELSLWTRLLAPAILTGLAALWTVASFLVTFSDYVDLRHALLAGAYATVHATVNNFRAGDGHQAESFVIDGHRFEYGSSTVTAGYNRDAAVGGLVREGLQVRIADVGGKIARLEIAQ